MSRPFIKPTISTPLSLQGRSKLFFSRGVQTGTETRRPSPFREQRPAQNEAQTIPKSETQPIRRHEYQYKEFNPIMRARIEEDLELKKIERQEHAERTAQLLRRTQDEEDQIRLQQKKDEYSNLKPDQLFRRKNVLEQEMKMIDDFLSKK